MMNLLPNKLGLCADKLHGLQIAGGVIHIEAAIVLVLRKDNRVAGKLGRIEINLFRRHIQ